MNKQSIINALDLAKTTTVEAVKNNPIAVAVFAVGVTGLVLTKMRMNKKAKADKK